MRTSQLEYFTAVAETLSFTRASQFRLLERPRFHGEEQGREFRGGPTGSGR